MLKTPIATRPSVDTFRRHFPQRRIDRGSPARQARWSAATNNAHPSWSAGHDSVVAEQPRAVCVARFREREEVERDLVAESSVIEAIASLLRLAGSVLVEAR